MNKRFVADYKAAYDSYPSFYAAQAYDTMMAIDHAVRTSDSTEAEAMRSVLAKGSIPTTRGLLAMNTNQFPVQNIYLREVILDKEGKATLKIVGTVMENHGDVYAKDCKL